MGESTSRRPPPDAKGTRETRKAASTEPEQDAQAQAQPQPDPRSGDPAKKQGPQSKFHGSDPRKH